MGQLGSCWIYIIPKRDKYYHAGAGVFSKGISSTFPGSSPGSPATKKERRISVSLLWLGYPDSNQERQDQNLQCYHYTIAQYIVQKRCKDTAFFRVPNILASFLPIMY